MNQAVMGHIDRAQVVYVEGCSGDLQRQRLADPELRLTVADLASDTESEACHLDLMF